ncbi:TonB-dependent receptor [Marivirga sp.]|uniref:TonB-dependent receptor n=1 Tax=Marivirga sp. TaxID=2018662 RepID=UPI002D7FDB8B|nr:carboxypeptidase regulatory-like domain-containing protein [Marivirga sp.]HET8860078.1 carboxypeptidase regulatory-like domain-containing protein [Marivirga sp.]
MKKILLSLCGIAILFAFATESAKAQGVTTAGLSGVVKDKEGEELPGATVQAVHTPSGTTYGSVTNASGRFQIPNMRIGGPYTVTVSFVGFQTYVLENINLSLGQTLNLNIELRSSVEQLGEVVVTAERNQVIDGNRTGASTNLSNERISSMPTINRSINDFTRLNPQSNGTSFGGADNRYNNYTIDGNLYNNNFGLGSSQFAGGNPISIDAIEEVQVNIAPYDVTQSGFTGASVNAVTKSGTNQIEASAYSLFRNQNTQGTTLNGGQEIVFSESKTQINGVTLGLPIIKDKLFFFGAFEYENNAIPGDNRRASRPEQGLLPSLEQNVARMTAKQAQFVRDQLREIYGYETGAFENYPFSDVATRLNLRLDYNLNQRNKIMLRVNSFQQRRDVGINGSSLRYINQLRLNNTNRFGPEALTFRNGNYGSEDKVQSVVGQWTSNISNNLSNKLNVGYTSTVTQRFIPGDQNFPMSEIVEFQGTTPLYFASLGTELFTRGNLLDNKTFNITNNLNYFMGAHTFTAGVNFEYMTFDNAFNPMWDSWYRWNSYDDFVAAVIDRDLSVRPAGFAIGFTYDENNPFELPTDRTEFGQVGLYVQDEYQATRDLKLTLGMRVELPFYPVDAPRNPSVEALGISVENPRNPGEFIEPRVDQFPSVNPVFSPRFGFNWDALGDKTLQVRGGTGIFTGRPIFVHLSNQINGNGVTRGGIGIEADEWGQDGNPEWEGFQADINYYRPNPAEQEPAVTSSLSITDQDFKLPQTWRSNLAVDYVFNGFVFTAEGIFSKDYNTPFSTNLSSMPTGESVIVGGNEYPTFTQVELGGVIDELYYLTNINDRTYASLTLGVEKDWGKGIFTSLAYTRSQNRDFGLGGGSQAASLWPTEVQNGRNNPEEGFSRNDQPNRVVGLISFNTKGLNETNNTSFNLYYSGGEQGRFSYTYSGDLSGENSGVTLMYIPENFEDAQLIDRVSGGVITQTAEEQWDILNNYIENDPYLSENRGSVSQRNGAVLPWLHRMDLSITQDIHLTKDPSKHKLQFRADILNVLNMVNDSWGVSRETVQRNLMNFEGTDANGNAQFTINPIQGESTFPTDVTVPNFDLSQTWSAQFGVKYIF